MFIFNSINLEYIFRICQKIIKSKYLVFEFKFSRIDNETLILAISKNR
jgi:hypothetical protein